MGIYLLHSVLDLFSITALYSYAECRVLFIAMLNVVMLNVVMLNVVMLNVVMLNAVMLSVVVLNVVAPYIRHLLLVMMLLWISPPRCV